MQAAVKREPALEASPYYYSQQQNYNAHYSVHNAFIGEIARAVLPPRWTDPLSATPRAPKRLRTEEHHSPGNLRICPSPSVGLSSGSPLQQAGITGTTACFSNPVLPVLGIQAQAGGQGTLPGHGVWQAAGPGSLHPTQTHHRHEIQPTQTPAPAPTRTYLGQPLASHDAGQVQHHTRDYSAYQLAHGHSSDGLSATYETWPHGADPTVHPYTGAAGSFPRGHSFSSHSSLTPLPNACSLPPISPPVEPSFTSSYPSFSAPQSHIPESSYHIQSYDPGRDHGLHSSLSSPTQFQQPGISPPIHMASPFSYPHVNNMTSFTPQGSPTSLNGLPSMLTDNAMMAPYSAIDRRYVMLVRDSEETGAVEAAEFSEQSDLDEQQVVPSHTPLSGSFEDLSRPLATYPSAAQGTTTVFSARATDLSPTGVKERKKRSQFNDEARKETSDTRSVGACLRCRNQRIRCSPNPLNSGAPCVSCAKVSKTNKKTIHRVHCIRYKFTSMIIYRGGGLNITKRFSHNQVVDVGEYADNNIVAIEMAQGLCQTPVRLQVRRFVPRQDDVLKRRYIGEDGVVKEQDLEPFCLADIEKTAKEFKRYINDNALDGLAEAVKDSDDMVKMTFHMIAEECRSDLNAEKGVKGKKPSKQARCESEQKEYLRQVVRLWFAIRHGIGSAWLCGSNTLGMQPVYSPNYSLDGKVAVPRMIVAQFDSIRHERIYKELTASVLKTSEKYLKSWNKDAWFTVYLATFLLLHQTSCASKDRHRWANENKGSTPMETRYGSIDDPLTGFVEKIQDGAVMLLTHWQYFKRCDLLNADWNNPSTSTLQYLKLYQFQHLKNTVAMLKLKTGTIPKTPADGCWEDELFWISHMFESAPSKDKETNWDPPESFTRAKPSVGRND